MTITDPRTLTSLLTACLLGGFPAGALWAAQEVPRPADIEVVSAADGAVLQGDVYLPAGEGPVAGIVLLGVTGPNDRDLRLGDLAPFEAIALHLAARGIAVMTLDDRGVGGSEGDWSRVGHRTLVADALSALDALTGLDRVDPDRVGLLGLSEGAAVAMMAAAEAPARVAFLVLASPPGRAGEEALRDQLEAGLARIGAPETVAQGWRTEFDRFLTLSRAGDVDGLTTFLEGPGAQLVPPYGFLPADAPGRAALFAGPWYRSQIDYRPSDFLGRVESPTLVLGGALDPILPPAANHPPIAAAIGSADLERHVVPDANHLLLPAETGLPDEYGRLTESAHPEVLARIAGWMRERGLLPHARPS